MNPTDQELKVIAENRAIKATNDEGAGSISYRMGARMGMASELYDALRNDRKSLELLRHARTAFVTAFAYWEEHGYKEESASQKERVKEVDEHIALLEERIGI